MPLYEYECTECKRHTEKIQKFSDPEITTCPHCGGTLQRVISAPAIAFKGSGWYKDLYSSPKPAAASSSGEGSAGAGESKPSSSETPASAPAAAGSTPAPSSPAPAAAPASAPAKPSSGS